ncbi:MAG: carbonic anhydrase, partial [Gammaproteobacteria bacterium]|nr:carbonic anhydrase [Gammaproteobacteria bacterium]
GVKYLGSPLIMVLGHENCGAVSAAVDDSGKIYGNVKSIIKAIIPAVKKAKQEYGTKDREKLIEKAIDENIRLVAADLVKRSSIIKKLAHNGKVKIVTAKYNLETGKVRLMQPILGK